MEEARAAWAMRAATWLVGVAWAACGFVSQAAIHVRVVVQKQRAVEPLIIGVP